MIRCDTDGIPCIVQSVRLLGRGLLRVRFFDAADVQLSGYWQADVFSLSPEEFLKLEVQLEEHWHKMRLFRFISRGGVQA